MRNVALAKNEKGKHKITKNVLLKLHFFLKLVIFVSQFEMK